MIASLYADDEILVLDKPAGLPSQPGEGVRVSLVEAVERDFGFRPFLVHRLDKETAGCVIVARSAAAASRWSSLVESRELRKTYRAVVSGLPRGGAGRFEEPVPTRGGMRSASTDWRLLGSFGAGGDTAGPVAGGPAMTGTVSGGGAASAAGPFSYLELELGTGRGHQIRIHLAAHSLPILGDDRHGDFPLNRALRKEAGLRRLLLVAWSLDLPGGARVRASVPTYLSGFLSLFPGAPAAEVPAPGPAVPGAAAAGAGAGRAR